MASNPRKFSEKIALHNQKQAEETAAFERIMHEVSETRYGQPRLHRPTSSNHLHPHPPYIPGRSLLGGSLPNVNTMAVNPQLDHMHHRHFDEVKMMSRHVGVEPRYAGRIESRPRPYDPRRAPALERNRSNLEQNRTNSSIYLPLPPESNWRRTNSDSALHQTALSAVQQPGSSAASGSSFVHGNPHHMQHQHNRKDAANYNPNFKMIDKIIPDLQGLNRPKSCEAPVINVVHSGHVVPQNDAMMTNGHLNYHGNQQLALPHHPPQIANTGSLPDLSSIQLPSTLMQQSNSQIRVNPQLDANIQGRMNPPNVIPPYMNKFPRPSSPGKHRRHTHNGPSPLILEEEARRIKYPSSVTSPKMKMASPPANNNRNHASMRPPSQHFTQIGSTPGMNEQIKLPQQPTQQINSPPSVHTLSSPTSPQSPINVTSPPQQQHMQVNTQTSVGQMNNNNNQHNHFYTDPTSIQPLQHQLEQFHVVSDYHGYNKNQDCHSYNNFSSGYNNFTGQLASNSVKDESLIYLNNKIPDITFTGVDDHHQLDSGEIPYQDLGAELKDSVNLEGMQLLEDGSNVITDPDNFALN